MGEMIIKGIDGRTLKALERLAEARHQTIEEAARDLLTTAVRQTRADALMAADRIRAMTPRHLTDSSTDLIRAARDSR